MSALIFCAVGNPLFYNESYKNEDHWRYTNNKREYETIVYQYNDFDIDHNTYDYINKGTGYKWQLCRDFLSNFNYDTYEYIGFMDDDLVTDYQSINRALQIAKEEDLKLFQLSTIPGSDSTHRVLHQQSRLEYSKTNFLEGMGPFIHRSLMPTFVELFKYHDFKSGWGLDIILSPILKTPAAVIHEVGMYHPPKPSYYDKNAAGQEMYYILEKIYPQFMMDRYNESVQPYNDPQREIEITIRTD